MGALKECLVRSQNTRQNSKCRSERGSASGGIAYRSLTAMVRRPKYFSSKKDKINNAKHNVAL